MWKDAAGGQLCMSELRHRRIGDGCRSGSDCTGDGCSRNNGGGNARSSGNTGSPGIYG